MKTIILIIILLVAVPAMAEQGALSWDASTKNEDGTPLTDLAGYHIYELTESKFDKIGTTEATVFLISPADDGKVHEYAVTAYDTSGNESKSAEISVTTLDLICPPPLSGLKYIKKEAVTTD